MSKITKADILKLATLARLKLSDSEIDRYQKEFTAILDYVEQLSSADTENLSPTYQVSGLSTITRPDIELDYRTTQKDLLKNVDKIRNSQIEVKRMIG